MATKKQEWSVELTLKHGPKFGPDDLEDRLDDLAAFFPAVSWTPEAASFRLTIPASSPDGALVKAIQAVGPGTYLGVSVISLDELEREIERPTIPELVGAAEIGEMAGVSRQRADQWTSSSDFPPPAVKTKTGRLWIRVSVSRWLERTPRRVGRPKHTAPDPA
jgi:hypothetical protein